MVMLGVVCPLYGAPEDLGHGLLQLPETLKWKTCNLVSSFILPGTFFLSLKFLHQHYYTEHSYVNEKVIHYIAPGYGKRQNCLLTTVHVSFLYAGWLVG